MVFFLFRQPVLIGRLEFKCWLGCYVKSISFLLFTFYNCHFSFSKGEKEKKIFKKKEMDATPLAQVWRASS